MVFSVIMRCLALVLVSAPALALPLELTGNFTQGGLLYGRVNPGTQVIVGRLKPRVSAAGEFIVGLDRDAPAQLIVELRGNGAVEQHPFTIAQRDYNIQRVEGIAQRIMQPSDADIARSRAEAGMVREARAINRDSSEFKQGFVWPVTGPISGVFGSQRVYNGVPNRPHYGVDIAAPQGTPVSTPAPGVVTLAHADMFYSGGTLVIDHGHGLSSSLLHLSKVIAKPGDRVNPGDIVGEVGATGRATGPHLDWRMNWYDRRLDPQLLVGPMPKE